MLLYRLCLPISMVKITKCRSQVADSLKPELSLPLLCQHLLLLTKRFSPLVNPAYDFAQILHVSSISYPLLSDTSPSGQLGRKRHLLNAARLLLLGEPGQGEATAPCPDPACCIFPLVSSPCSSVLPEYLFVPAE